MPLPANHFTGAKTAFSTNRLTDTREYNQWQRQCSKGARSFRGQKIIQPGHPDALFFLKKVDYLFQSSPPKHRPPAPFHRQNKTNKAVRYGNIFIFCSHHYRSKAIRRARQGAARSWARAVDLPAGSFEPVRPGVAPPMNITATRVQHKNNSYK